LRLGTYLQWLKCNGTQWNAVPQPAIIGSEGSSTLDSYYNADKKHTATDRGGGHI